MSDAEKCSGLTTFYSLPRWPATRFSRAKNGVAFELILSAAEFRESQGERSGSVLGGNKNEIGIAGIDGMLCISARQRGV